MEAKCPVCDYEYDEKWNKRENSPGYDIEVTKGDEKFISITGNFFVKPDESWKDGHKVSLLACPKCKSIKLND